MPVTCENGCGRDCAQGPDGRTFKTCCRTCAHLKKEGKGAVGHDIACDIATNEAVCPPWYWKSYASWPEPFREECGGEYVRQMGTKILQRRLPDREVVRCVRVEDAVLWNLYAAKRAQIRERAVSIEDLKPEINESLPFSAKTTLDGSVNEVWLLHGTSEEASKAIAKSSFIGSTGGCFGTGAYFADEAQKSNQYAKGQTEDGCKVMLLCRVVLGNVMRLEKGQDRTADRYADDPNIDSVLGFTDSREFVIYDMAQIYPEYIMHYKVVGDTSAA
eukprot:TRINITY_DN34459_c0_g1_i1.p2 TRINITY_DN34459_c0_g1~~TRINITY_DN34459_c0_g1_i1.p2  ORF type:complete len:274 (-),score=61.76 TRINITY_DN34459_c0_g1_i1:100-921(-)